MHMYLHIHLQMKVITYACSQYAVAYTLAYSPADEGDVSSTYSEAYVAARFVYINRYVKLGEMRFYHNTRVGLLRGKQFNRRKNR